MLFWSLICWWCRWYWCVQHALLSATWRPTGTRCSTRNGAATWNWTTRRHTTLWFEWAAPGLASPTPSSRCSTTMGGTGLSFCPMNAVVATTAVCQSRSCCLRRRTSPSTGSTWLRCRLTKRLKIIFIRYKFAPEVGRLMLNNVYYWREVLTFVICVFVRYWSPSSVMNTKIENFCCLC